MSNQLSVLHVGKYFPPYHGGMERFLHELVEKQAASGTRVSVLVHEHRKTRGEIEKGAYTVYRAPTIGVIMYAPISPLFPWYLTKALSEQKPDVVHLHMPNLSAFWVLFVPAVRRIPWMVHWHSDVIFPEETLRYRVARKLYGFFEGRLLARAKRIVATSPTYLENSEVLRTYRGKVKVIPLGITDPPTVVDSGCQAMPEWPPGESKLIAVGRLSHYKGFAVLIEAVRNIDDLAVLIVGSGPEEQALRTLITTYRLEAKVRLVGGVGDPELDRLMRQSDMLCLPSIEKTEAFGMVLLEAMAREKPCIVTDVQGSGMSWVVKHQETGLVSESGNGESLARQIEYLMQNKDEARSMGKNGRQRYLRTFDIENARKGLDEEYAELLGAAGEER